MLGCRKRPESDESKNGSEEASTGESNGLNSELLANITGPPHECIFVYLKMCVQCLNLMIRTP